MATYESLKPYWTWTDAVSGSGCIVCKVDSVLRPGEFRIAWTIIQSIRWRFTMPLTESYRDNLFISAKKDLSSSVPIPRISNGHFAHCDKLLRRQFGHKRWQKHRAKMEGVYQSKNDPLYGIF